MGRAGRCGKWNIPRPAVKFAVSRLPLGLADMLRCNCDINTSASFFVLPDMKSQSLPEFDKLRLEERSLLWPRLPKSALLKAALLRTGLSRGLDMPGDLMLGLPRASCESALVSVCSTEPGSGLLRTWKVTVRFGRGAAAGDMDRSTSDIIMLGSGVDDRDDNGDRPS